MQLDVDVTARFEPRAEPGRRTAHALADRADPAVPTGEHRDDAVGLAEFVYAEDDRLVTVERHEPMVASPCDRPRLQLRSGNFSRRQTGESRPIGTGGRVVGRAIKSLVQQQRDNADEQPASDGDAEGDARPVRIGDPADHGRAAP